MTTVFKVGDKVRRKKSHFGYGFWPSRGFGERVCTVSWVSTDTRVVHLELQESPGMRDWEADCFELAVAAESKRFVIRNARTGFLCNAGELYTEEAAREKALKHSTTYEIVYELYELVLVAKTEVVPEQVIPASVRLVDV